jgi:cytochrome P450
MSATSHPHDFRTSQELLTAATVAIEQGRDARAELTRMSRAGTFHFDSEGHSYVYGYELSRALLRSPELLKGGQHVSSVPSGLTPEQARQLSEAAPPDPAMLTSIDNPEHARLRRSVGRAFAPKIVAGFGDVTRRAVDEAVGDLSRDRPVDLIPALCERVSGQVIGELIGLPEHDRAEFMRMANVQQVGRSPGASFDDQLRALTTRRSMFDYIAAVIDEARRSPIEGTPVGHLLQEQAKGAVSQEELVSLVALLYSAGFTTTVRLLGNGLAMLMTHQEQGDLLRADPSLARAFTNEVARYAAPVATVAYHAGEGAQIEDVPMPFGSTCTILIGLANRDERVFDAPNTFDILAQRSSIELAFGSGVHFCLGVHLAKLELDILLTEMTRRFPAMQLASPLEPRPLFRVRDYAAINAVLVP